MNAKMPKSAVTETYTLPSGGKLYGEEFSPEVTIRSMTTFEEKKRLGNQGFHKTMCSIIDSVVVSPENFETQYMTLFDYHFLMYKMRTVSYGPTYKVSVTCPHCGRTFTSKVNLDDLEITQMPEDMKEPFIIGPLPRSGDTLECRFLRVIDSMNVERKAKEILKRSPDYEGDPEYILNMCAKIVSVNGEEKMPPEIQMYVERMGALDAAYFNQAYNKIVDRLGMSVDCHDMCDCGEDVSFSLPFNSEFFRPTFDF